MSYEKTHKTHAFLEWMREEYMACQDPKKKEFLARAIQQWKERNGVK